MSKGTDGAGAPIADAPINLTPASMPTAWPFRFKVPHHIDHVSMFWTRSVPSAFTLFVRSVDGRTEFGDGNTINDAFEDALGKCPPKSFDFVEAFTSARIPSAGRGGPTGSPAGASVPPSTLSEGK